MELIFEISKPGRAAVGIPASDVPPSILNSDRPSIFADDLDLPEVRKLTGPSLYQLSRRNFASIWDFILWVLHDEIQSQKLMKMLRLCRFYRIASLC
jgi:hypothetical protein